MSLVTGQNLLTQLLGFRVGRDARWNKQTANKAINVASLEIEVADVWIE